LSARYRGWRFVLPELDVSGAATGLQLGRNGEIAMIEDDDAIRQSLLLLISTRPGERIMRPEYGCELHRLVFSPNDDTTAGLAIHYVRRAVERWEPRVEAVRVDATRRPDDDAVLDVVLEYRVRATRRAGRLVIPISLYEEVAA
jgi:phage baseplate assembly protein W